ncbi:activating transcription factor 7-interacting protein 1-like [Cloeon dipterum]|uniref:activating transcription factor 7-interacting protein 1-like n=1 Tax=Cloeon dipterum TaxID=197152 RepID=UPI0032200E26
MRQLFKPGICRFSELMGPPTLPHPAPLPSVPFIPPRPGWKQPPPEPHLKVRAKPNGGIMLSWNLKFNSDHEDIKFYRIYAYEETSEEPSQLLWRTVGDVVALTLPMACTLTQFKEGYTYHFAVRAVDMRNRLGQSSNIVSIHLKPPNHSKL